MSFRCAFLVFFTYSFLLSTQKQMAGVTMTQAEFEAKKALFAELYESWLDTARNKKKNIDVTHLVHGKSLYTCNNTSSSLFWIWTDWQACKWIAVTLVYIFTLLYYVIIHIGETRFSLLH